MQAGGTAAGEGRTCGEGVMENGVTRRAEKDNVLFRQKKGCSKLPHTPQTVFTLFRQHRSDFYVLSPTHGGMDPAAAFQCTVLKSSFVQQRHLVPVAGLHVHSLATGLAGALESNCTKKRTCSP